jgi:hypothetical protein
LIQPGDIVLLEWLRSYGEAVGEDTFRTCFFCGRVYERCMQGFSDVQYHEMCRTDVLLELFGYSKKVSKAMAKARAREFFPQTGGGSIPSIGTKKQPGPLRLMSNKDHSWDALELWLAWGLKNKREKRARMVKDDPEKINPFV